MTLYKKVFVYRTQLYADDTIEENIISEQSYVKPSWLFGIFLLFLFMLLIAE